MIKSDTAILSLLNALADDCQRNGNTRGADHFTDMILDLTAPEPVVIPITWRFMLDGKIMPPDFQPGCY